MPEPHTVAIPTRVHRVGRATDPLYFSRITPADAVLPRAGNRYDVAGGGVLYAATQPRACFGETVARFRPSPRMREVLADEEPHFMLCGGIPRDWRLKRVLVELRAVDPLPFLDVDHIDTQAHLSAELAPVLVGLGYDENLDLAAIRSHDRRLSRAIALWAYTATDEDGGFRYGGIRYASRVSDRWENWAIFDGTDLVELDRHSIEASQPDLVAVARSWDLVVH